MATITGTSNLKALLDSKKDIIVLEGSSRSSKTFSIIQFLIIQCLSKKITVRSFRAEQTVCRKTLVPDFLLILETCFPELSPKKFNKQEACYYFDNGSKYHFEGCDSGKLHGMRQDIAHINEVMEVNYSSWSQIAARTTGKKVFDYNPSLTHHWVFSTILTRDTSEFDYIHSTFKDNKFLTQQQVSEIEGWEPTKENKVRGTADSWLWDVYGLGKRGRRHGTIYTRWTITEDWPDKNACNRWGYGLDFGYSLDPTALVECALFQDQLYIRELVYETKLVATRSESNPRIPCIENKLKELKVDHNDKIYADCARPDSIAEIAGVGYNIHPCHKGVNSVASGIQRLQRFNMRVHISSQNLQIELENYTWKIDNKTDRVLDEPIDEFNHALDAIRYWGMEELEPVVPMQYRSIPGSHVAEEQYEPFAGIISNY